MNDKLGELAELFRQRAELDKQILDLIGEPSDDGSEEEEEEETPIRKKAKRKPGKYNKHNPMPEEVKEQIRARHLEGATLATLIKEFGVSSSSISKALKTKPDRLTTKHKDVNSYVCVNGHEFKSKLPLLDVVCPVCHSTDCDLGSLNGEVEENDV
jgi:hypothetical protein